MSNIDNALNFECPKCGANIGEKCRFDESDRKKYQDVAKTFPIVNMVHAERFMLVIGRK